MVLEVKPTECDLHRNFAMYGTPLKRPDERKLRTFKLAEVGNDTVGEYLTKGFSLAVCCVDCPHITEWTPPELERRFGDWPQHRIAEVVKRLKCTEPDCGSKKVAVWPRTYELAWTWAPSG